MGEARLGRPCLPPDQRHEVRKSVYLSDAEAERLRRLRFACRSPSDSAFLAELIQLGLQVKLAQMETAREMIDPQQQER